MPQMYRQYEFTIEVTNDEQLNLQRFLLQSFRLALKCFPTPCSTIMNGVSAEQSLNSIVQPLNQGLIEP